jgi:hypothetical protein
MLTGTQITAQTKPGSIQGVWQTVEVSVNRPHPNTITIPEPRPNLLVVTEKHYSRVEVHTEKPRQIPADVATASADDLRAVWGPFVGEAGTYEVAGNVLTMRPIAAKNPATMVPGAFINYTIRIDGNTMWVTQVLNQDGPFTRPATIKLVRVE